MHPADAAPQTHGQGTTGRAIGQAAPRIEFEIISSMILSSAGVKDCLALGVIKAAEQAGQLRPGHANA
jgi:hypothetical protein